MWGSTFCVNGLLGDESISFVDGHIMFPFAGPLPCSDSPPPVIEFFLESGAVSVKRSFCADLSDAEALDITVKSGHNRIEIPECDGHSFVSIGLYGTFTVSDLRAEVHRYLAEAEMPEIDAGDEFTIRISDGIDSNHSLRHLIADYCNMFWW